MKVNEIFYSLQGEGCFTGTPAVFVRLSGCNARCAFCDTNHQNGTEMSEEEIVQAIAVYPTRHVVITGGEPVLQLTPHLTALLHSKGYFIQIETNGSVALQDGCEIDWITCSPKDLPLKIQRIDELKVLFDSSDSENTSRIARLSEITAKEYRLQPLDAAMLSADEELAKRNKNNLEKTIEYILENPKWKLSLQTHKIINVR